MGNLWLKIKIWTKGLLFAAIFIYILLFISFNQKDIEVWVFPRKVVQSTALVLAFFAFLTGVLVTVLVRTTLVTYKQIRELQDRTRTVKLERTVQDLHAKAAKLRAKPTGIPAPTLVTDEIDEEAAESKD